MKLLFLTRTRSNTGGHIVLINLVREIRKLGHEVSLVAFCPQGEDRFPGCEELWIEENPELIEIPYVSDSERQVMEYVKAGAVFLKNNCEKFDRVIVDSWLMAYAAVLSGQCSNKVYHLAQSAVFKSGELSADWRGVLFSILPRFPLQRISVSKWLQNDLRSRFDSESFFMPLFIDDEYFRSNFSVKEKVSKLISVASDFNKESKGLNQLLENLDGFSDYPIKLTLVSGKSINIDPSKLSYPVEILTANNPQEMRKILEAHDIYINFSNDESFCLTLAEAMAVGLPCVVLDSGGNSEYIDDKNSLLLNHPKELPDALSRLRDQKERVMLSQHAKATMEKYTLDKTVKSLCEIMGI